MRVFFLKRAAEVSDHARKPAGYLDSSSIYEICAMISGEIT